MIAPPIAYACLSQEEKPRPGETRSEDAVHAPQKMGPGELTREPLPPASGKD